MQMTKKKVTQLLSEYRRAREQYKVEKAELKKVRLELKYLSEAQQIVQHVVQAVQQQTHKRISTIVSRCLNLIFEDAYEFKLIFERKRGTTEARPVFIRRGNEIDPKYSSGGGVIDVTSFALRLSCVILARPRRRRLLVLDEPFKMVSIEYRERIRIMLEVLSKELKVQIIMVTHDKALMIGNVIDLSERKK